MLYAGGTEKKGVRIFLWAFLLLFPIICFTGFSPAEGTVFVTQDGAGDENGSSWEDAYGEGDLQTAVDAAKTAGGGEVWVAAGVYRPSPAGDQSACFTLKTGVALYGGFSGTENDRNERNWEKNLTVLTGDLENDDTNKVDGVTVSADQIVGTNSNTVVKAGNADNTAILDGFTVCGGNNAAGEGGGMYNDSGSPGVINCTFTGNAAQYGGGIFNNTGSLLMTNCIFSGNAADEDGGGVCNGNNGSPQVHNCTLTGNIAGTVGGGIYNDSGSPGVANCTFSGNNANWLGGGMYNNTGSPEIFGCTFNGNAAAGGGGGGLSNLCGSPEIINCTFSGNKAPGGCGGGVLLNWMGSPKVANCTLTGNTAQDGGGMYNEAGSPEVVNCIFWGNNATSGENEIHVAGGSVAVTYSVVQGDPVYSGEGNTTDDPKLGDLADNGGATQTCTLGAGSSALGTGDPASTLTTDQRGESRPRPIGTPVDMGSVERKQFAITATAGSHGTITPSGSVKVPSGEGQTFTFTPDGGCQVDEVSVDANSKGALLSYRFENVTGDHTIAASFKVVPTSAPAPNPGPGPEPTPTVVPTAEPTPTQTPTIAPTVVPSTTPQPTPRVTTEPLQGDIQPGLTIMPTPNEEDPKVQELKKELDDPESAPRRELEATIQEEVAKALKEKVGREIDPEKMKVEVHASEAYRFENVPLNRDDGLGTVTIPVIITYEEPGQEKVQIFFTMVLVYDLTTNPPTPLEYRMVALQEEQDSATGEMRDIYFVVASEDSRQELVGHLQVRDQSEYDGNPKVGVVSTKYMFLYADGDTGETPTPGGPSGSPSGSPTVIPRGGSGGCSLGFVPLWLLLALPLVLLRK